MSGIAYKRFFLNQLIALSVLSVCCASESFAQESHPTNPQLERQKQLKANALNRIGAQVDDRTTNYIGAAQIQASRIHNTYASAADQLHQRNQSTLSAMRNAVTYVVGTDGRAVPVAKYSENDINLAAENFRLQESAYADNAQAKVSQVQIEAARRAKLYSDERKSLESQFANSNIGTARLTPLGTNLYVRNYELAGGAESSDPNTGVPGSRGATGNRAGRAGSLPVAAGNKNVLQKAPSAPVSMQARALTLKDVLGDEQALSGSGGVRTSVTGSLVH